MANSNGTQWPIDPALQDPATAGSPSPAPSATTTTTATTATTTPAPTATLNYAQYAHYYQPSAYSHYYMHPQQARTATATPTPAATTTAPATTSTTTQGVDNTDVATLNDALGSAGVDLRAEEERLQNTNTSQASAYRTSESDRSRKQPLNVSFKTTFLGTTMRSIGTNHKVSKIPEDSINYLALALRARLQDLITDMIDASKHRNNTQFDRPASLYDDKTPMWSLVIKKDVRKQLEALEKAEREEENKHRRERKERAELAAAQLAAYAAQQAETDKMNTDGYEDGDANPKKKRKKEGPGVTAKNMSEDVRMQMSNMVAAQASGIGKKYSWMTAANAAGGSPAPKAKTETAAASGSPAGAASPSVPPRTNGASTTYKPYVSSMTKPLIPTTATEDEGMTRITMRDAMFVIEKERGHGGGRGAALGWT